MEQQQAGLDAHKAQRDFRSSQMYTTKNRQRVGHRWQPILPPHPADKITKHQQKSIFSYLNLLTSSRNTSRRETFSLHYYTCTATRVVHTRRVSTRLPLPGSPTTSSRCNLNHNDRSIKSSHKQIYFLHFVKKQNLLREHSFLLFSCFLV